MVAALKYLNKYFMDKMLGLFNSANGKDNNKHYKASDLS